MDRWISRSVDRWIGTSVTSGRVEYWMSEPGEELSLLALVKNFR